MDKQVRRRRLGWLASFCWMVVIFLFSAQDATESTESSSFVMELLCSLFGFEVPIDPATHEFTGMAIFLLRKGAHFFVFTVLGFLFCTTICQYPDATSLQKVALPLALGILYACVDELHQYFVPGRACQIRDVCIDTCGVLCGVVLALVLVKWRSKLRQKKAERRVEKPTT